MRKTLSAAFALAVTLMLTNGCGRAAGSVSDACEVYGYIYPAVGDTMETKRQVLEHNLLHQQLCDY
jgi:hypothetical protein